MPAFSSARRATAVGLCAAACAALLAGCSKNESEAQEEAWWTPNSVPQPKHGAPTPPQEPPASAAPAAQQPPADVEKDHKDKDHEKDEDHDKDKDRETSREPKPAPAPAPAPEPAPAPAPGRSGNGEHIVPNVSPDHVQEAIRPKPLPKAEDVYVPVPDLNQPLPKAEDVYIPLPQFP